MSEPRAPVTSGNDDLDAALRDLGTRIAFPPTPDLAASIRRAVAETRDEPARITRFPLRRIAVAAAIVVLALVAALSLLDGFRGAVADLFGVRGVKIVVERATSTPVPTTTVSPTTATPPAATPAPPAPVGARLLLGSPVSLEEARQRVPYPVHVPALPSLGDPDEVYVRALPDGNLMVSLVYRPTADLPDTVNTGAGLLLMQFEARNDVGYIGKQVSNGEGWFSTTVNGNFAIWIQGAHEMALLSDPSRSCCTENPRLAGNVLLWEDNGVTYRLESALPLERARAIAESLEPFIATPVAAGARDRASG